MDAWRGYGALFRAALSGGNVVRSHAIAEHLPGTRVRVRPRLRVRAGLWKGGKHRLVHVVGRNSSNRIFGWSGLERKGGAAGCRAMMTGLRGTVMRFSYANIFHWISDLFEFFFRGISFAARLINCFLPTAGPPPPPLPSQQRLAMTREREVVRGSGGSGTC
jgi:hypothetical protein